MTRDEKFSFWLTGLCVFLAFGLCFGLCWYIRDIQKPQPSRVTLPHGTFGPLQDLFACNYKVSEPTVVEEPKAGKLWILYSVEKQECSEQEATQ